MSLAVASLAHPSITVFSAVPPMLIIALSARLVTTLIKNINALLAQLAAPLALVTAFVAVVPMDSLSPNLSPKVLALLAQLLVLPA